MNANLIWRSVFACAGLLGPSGAWAAEGLTGDWDGKRTAWRDAGIVMDMGYTVEAARNTSGGARRASAHAGQLSAAAQLDLQQLWDWKDTRAEVALSLRDGDEVSRRAGLGTLIQVQEIHGRGHIPRLSRLWLEKRMADGRLAVKAGRMGVGEDFDMLECSALNLALCGGQVAVFGGDYWFNGPVSQWGAVLTLRSGRTYLRSGAYQVNPRYAATSGGGLRIAPSGTVGTLTPMELGWEPTPGGLPGKYVVGGWYSSAPRADARTLPAPGVAPVPRARSGTYGGWAVAQQQLTRGRHAAAQSGLRAQLGYAQGDPRTGYIDQMLSLQLAYTGLAVQRADDTLGLGVASTRVNPRAALMQRGADGGTPRREHVAELFYGWKPIPSLYLQPSVQYIRHPGGLSARRDATVVGLKADVRF